MSRIRWRLPAGVVAAYNLSPPLALTDSGFVVADSGASGVTCVVNRSWPQSLEPHCYDEEGAASVLPMELRRTELSAASRKTSVGRQCGALVLARTGADVMAARTPPVARPRWPGRVNAKECASEPRERTA